MSDKPMRPGMDPGFELVLVDPKPQVVAAFAERFDGYPRVRTVLGPFESLPAFDAMVSAANSFGLMDGGVDAALTQYYGWELERRVQRHIIEEFHGEQPVGTAFVVDTGHPENPYVVHAPTMRVPMDITRTDNVYLAMWAVLRAVSRHNKLVLSSGGGRRISWLACPGLGTGTGHVPAREAARQMALAYGHFVNPPLQLEWGMATDRQVRIRYGGDFGFHFPPEDDVDTSRSAAGG